MNTDINDAPRYSCDPSDGLHFVGGLTASEDLAVLPGTDWLVLGGLNIGSPARLYLIDARTQCASILFPLDPPLVRPDAAYGGDRQSPPRLATMSTSGINVRVTDEGDCLLYACNHGDRHAIEIFRIELRGRLPTAAWIGCLPLPVGTLAAAVVPLAQGGLLVSSFYDPRDKNAWLRMERGEPTGSLWEWHRDTGFRELETGGISGANGLEVSADERFIYASAWSARELLILERASGASRRIPLEFLPDNIKRSADGTLLIAAQQSTVAKIAACDGPECPQDWVVARVDPVRDRVTPLLSRPGNALVNYACAALELNGTLYITGRGDHRVAYVPLSLLPSLR
jgi:hypothetical protein